MSHVRPESESGPDETVHAFQTVLPGTFQKGVARISISAFPIHRSSIHKAGEETFANNAN